MNYRRRQGFAAPLNPDYPSRGSRKQNIRFGVNRGKASKNSLVIDEHIQEATPEHLRIEIDQIINDFLADPEKTEHIFPPDYNNLQRKYIHYKAQIMNLVSKSQGKDPNRQLHLKKKPKQLASQSFQLSVCDEVYNELEKFVAASAAEKDLAENHRVIKCSDKVYARIQSSEPVVPRPPKVSQELRRIRENLPIFEKRDHVLDTINNNQVTIVSSETGSGKTTQVPQYILEDACVRKKRCKIMCTQPRRISTVSAAERVSFERGETVGGTVGYQIRLDSKCGYTTSLLFCTVGIFLRNLMCGSECLKHVTHVVVDEIHERDKLSDFLLICLKQNLPRYKHLKVILMSATVDTTKFQEYFNSSAVLSIPGRLFPIQTYFIGHVLSMTRFVSPQMRVAMRKLEQQRVTSNPAAEQKAELSEQDQTYFNNVLEAYMNFSDDYNYMVHYEEATADLLHLFISEDMSVDQQHSGNGWTTLMIACHLGDLEFVSKLCSLGANLDVADKMGKTAYDYGRLCNKNDVLALLDELKTQKTLREGITSVNDPEYLKQIYDMTTPDDFIDYDLIVELIKYVDANSDFGSILVFLPGYDEIMQCNDCIVESTLPSDSYRIFFLHSSMNMKDQCDVFQPLQNQRKLILSTNIAETSITVEDVVFVIDVGKAKEKVYDSYNKLSTLQTQWISRACAKQRQGRAGRVRPGICFRMYSEQRYNHMPEDRVPEILRVSLEELCLHAKIIAPEAMNIYSFLCLAPDPPSASSVGAAIEHLQALGALDKEEDLTKLGEYLSQLTLEPRIGKMLILSCIFKCLEPMLTICSSMAHKDPFQLPPQANLKTVAAAKRRELIDGVASDHAIYLLVFQKWQAEVTRGRSKQFCHEYFISESTMYSVLETRRQLLAQLRAAGFVSNGHTIEGFNHSSNSWGLVKGIMSAAFFPNVAYPVQRGLALATRNEKKVCIHNTSVCSTKKFEHWYFYDEMVKNRISFMVRGVTICSPLTIAIMCGIDSVYPSSHSVNLDDWLEFYFGDNLVIKFRQAVHALVDRSIANPLNAFNPKNAIITDTLCTVMDMIEKNCGFVQPEKVGARPRFLYKLVKEIGESANSRPITRNGMRSSRDNGIDDGVEYSNDHRSGRNPRRYIPPQQRNVFYNTRSATTATFDPSEPSTSATTGLSQHFNQLTVNSGQTTQANTLLRGLGATANVENPENSSFQQPPGNFGYRNGFREYQGRPQFNNFNSFHENFPSCRRGAQFNGVGNAGASSDGKFKRGNYQRRRRR